ncbi:DUF6591 domain-containing protein [Lachnospiraceae bacterium 48-42]|nr:hypothetical protein [Dorea sp.]
MSGKPKMVICRNCNAPIAKNASICPSCGAKNKKPFYKKGWFIVLLVIFAIGIVNSVVRNKEDLKTVRSVEIQKSDEEDESEVKSEPEGEAAKEENESEVKSEPEGEAAKEEKAKENPKSRDKSVDGMRPEFKKAMDSYEEFMTEYCEFMKKYGESDGTDLGLVADYADYMSKYAEWVKDFEGWDDGEMNTEEAAYYLDIQNRISKKLIEVAN